MISSNIIPVSARPETSCVSELRSEFYGRIWWTWGRQGPGAVLMAGDVIEAGT